MKPVLGAWRRGDIDAPNKLAIGICTLGNIRAEVAVPLMMSSMPLGQAQLFVVPVGYGIQDARNLAWYRADVEGWEYFMFWDDDCAPLTGGTVETMLEAMEQNPQIDILGGVYPARQNIPAPIVLREQYGAPWWGWEDGKIHRVWMTGTGYTMYRMASIKKLRPETRPFNIFGQVVNMPQYFCLENGTDDYALAKDAEAAGLRWYVHGGIVCDQVESNGARYEVKNARQQITEENDERRESGDSTGGDTGRSEHMGSPEEPRPSHVFAG